MLLSPYVVTNVDDFGPGSLREALLEQASPITFAIGSGVQTIRPVSQLPNVAADGTLIDGTTQPGYAGTPLIVIDGTQAPSSANGLVVTGANCTVKGLVIDNFRRQAGIRVQQLTGGALLTDNYLGTDATGTLVQSNMYGVLVDFGSQNNVIADNLVSANNWGIQLLSQHARVVGNRIGTDASGRRALGNGIGVHVNTGDAAYNVIGGTAPEDRNLISGNGTGVYLAGIFDEVLGNYIGTDAAGTVAIANSDGIYADGSGGDTVGGTAPGAGNVISGNGSGIFAAGALSLVEGNLIGLNASGTAALPNNYGIHILDTNVTIGGAEVRAGNVISGNLSDGLFVEGGTGPVQGNYIGTNPAGTAAIPNGRDGLELTNGAALTVGGTAAGAGNLIADNAMDGLSLTGPYDVVQGNTIASNGRDGLSLTGSYGLIQDNAIGTDGAHTMTLPNHRYGLLLAGSNNTIGGPTTAARNVIAGNRSDGVFLSGASDFNLIQGNVIAANSGYGVNLSASADHNVLLGNAIGTTPNGRQAYPNGLSGILVFGSQNTIGGTAATAGNLVSGNTGDGIVLDGPSNLVEGNVVGTDLAGTVAVGNGGNGVYIGSFSGVSGNTVGGSVPGAGNLIAGNGAYGLDILGPANVVQGNIIGTSRNGRRALPNGFNGVAVYNAANTIGGATAGAGNLISGNTRAGVLLCGLFRPTTGNLVQGNLIGTDASGTVALGNGEGVLLEGGAFNNTIGGTAAGAGNVIAGNLGDGITLSDPATTANLVQGNVIGTDASGTLDLANGGNGVAVVNGAGNTIGGTDTGAGNVIAFNGNDGVLVDTGSGNAIQQNSIFSSSNLAIELLNGGNNSQAAPVLTAVTSDDSGTTIAGTLTSAPDTTFTLEFYANDLSNPSGYGEGQTFLGAATVTTDDSGTATFTVTLDGGVAAGQYVSATATDPAGNTSAFAASWQLPSTASPSVAALRTAVPSGPLSPPSAPAQASPAEHRADALFRTLGPEAGQPSAAEGGSFADTSVRTAALPTRTGDLRDVGADLLSPPEGFDLR